MIIDCHCHAGPGDGLSHPSNTRADLRRYCSRARAAGITHTVLFGALGTDYREANREVAQLIQRRPGRFIGFVSINPDFDRGHIGSIVQQAVAGGFAGIKVHWSNGRVTREVADAARRHRIPVLYDPRGDTATIELIAREYPDVGWIIPHLSSYAEDWGAQMAFIDQLKRIPNVFTDTSGVRNFDVLLDAVQRAGPQKVLFGSDGPWLHPALELGKIRLLGLAPHQEALITAGNLLRLIRTRR